MNHLSSHFGTFLVQQNPVCSIRYAVETKSGRPLPAVHIGTSVAMQTYMSACCVLQIV